MEKAKFWLTQVVMVAFVSLVFGAPVMAHGDRGHGWSKKWSKHKDYSNEKRDARYHKKMTRKMGWLKNKIDKLNSPSVRKASKKKQNRRARKAAWLQKMYDRYEVNLKAHDDKYHYTPVPCEEGFTLDGDNCVQDQQDVSDGPTCDMFVPGWIMGPGGVWPDNCMPAP